LSAKQLSDGKRYRHRDSTLSISEVMTIVILYQLSGFRNFKTYYTRAHLRASAAASFRTWSAIISISFRTSNNSWILQYPGERIARRLL
jgi:hypothetical protein